MAAGFRVERSVVEDSRGQVELISVSGDLDVATIDRFWGEISAAGASGQPLLLDLTTLDFMDSTGLRGVLRAVDRGSPVAVVIESGSQVARILEIAGVDDLIQVFGERGAALEKLLE
jgi:anti-anti-sigma factor